MPFVKLSTSLPDSSIWNEPSDTRICWICLLTMADATGLVSSTLPGIARRANISIEAAKKALQVFESPDEFSKDPENEGRRIERVSGGYQVLNYLKYRQHDPTGYERLKRFRENQKIQNFQATTIEKKARVKKGKLPVAAFDSFWTAYPKKVGKGAAEKAWRALGPDNELLQQILHALEWQRQQDQWTKDGGQFIPYPSTWLNQKRWMDERPAGGSGRSSLNIGAPRPEPSEPVDEVAGFMQRFPEDLQPMKADFEAHFGSGNDGAALAGKLLDLFAGNAEYESKVSRFLEGLAPKLRSPEIERTFRLNYIKGKYAIPEIDQEASK